MAATTDDHWKRLVSGFIASERNRRETSRYPLSRSLSNNLKALSRQLIANDASYTERSSDIRKIYKSRDPVVRAAVLSIAMHSNEGAVLSSEHRIKLLLEEGEFTPSAAIEPDGGEKRPDSCPICIQNKRVTYRKVGSPGGNIDVRIVWYYHVKTEHCYGVDVPCVTNLDLMHPMRHQTFGHLHAWRVNSLDYDKLAMRYLWKTYLSWSTSVTKMGDKETNQIKLIPADDFLFPLTSWIKSPLTRMLFLMRSAFYMLGYPPGLKPGMTFLELTSTLWWFSIEPLALDILDECLRLDCVPIAVHYADIMHGRVNMFTFAEEHQLPATVTCPETGTMKRKRVFESIWTDIEF
jgi:hypothetical protein